MLFEWYILEMEQTNLRSWVWCQLRPLPTEAIACLLFSDLSICHPTQHLARAKIRSCITKLKYFSLLKVLTARSHCWRTKVQSWYLVLHTKMGLALFAEWPQDNGCQCLRDIFSSCSECGSSLSGGQPCRYFKVMESDVKRVGNAHKRLCSYVRY